MTDRMMGGRQTRLMSAALLLLLAGPGCSSAASSVSPGGDAGDTGVDHGGVDQGGATCPARPDLLAAAPVCNTVTNNAPSVPFTTGTGTPPALNGGAIADGLYEATKAEGFGTVTPSGRRLTLVILDGATQMLWSGDVLATVLSSFTANATMAVSGNQITITPTCSSTTPAPLPPAVTYQSTATELRLALIDSGGNGAITTYTRRGCAP